MSTIWCPAVAAPMGAAAVSILRLPLSSPTQTRISPDTSAEAAP
ncbi:MAG TPA: hypothetical protein VMT69_00535 [Kineosporiaceae bacterium]|nr:hypothetical protein [Kineosporiaceae bacterium]